MRNVWRQATTSGAPLMDALFDEAGADETEFPRKLAEEMRWRWEAAVRPSATDAAELKRECPARLALRHRVLPLAFETVPDGGRRLRLACYDPFDLQARQAVARATSVPVQWQLAPRSYQRDERVAVEQHRVVGDRYGVGDAVVAVGAQGDVLDGDASPGGYIPQLDDHLDALP